MVAVTATETQGTSVQAAGTLKLRGAHTEASPDAFPDMEVKGYTVVPGVLSREKAASYLDRAYSWLEAFGLGFDRNDESTWHMKNLPPHTRGGMWTRYGMNQEQYNWDIRSEPEVIKVFAKIWGTEELLVSFDGASIAIPLPDEEFGDMVRPWPHVDQNPVRRYKHCIQGIMNLNENGPNDGGLMVLEGSSVLFNDFFDAHPEERPESGWPDRDFFPHTEAHQQWFYDRGCKWVKVCAQPGDVILWDSRTVHYGAVPQGRVPRVASYVCYKPAADITPEMLERKQTAARNLDGTSHDPLEFRLTGALERGRLAPDERLHPPVPPVLSDRALQLAGLKPY